VKYKKVFLDANVIADVYDKDRPFYLQSREAVKHLSARKGVMLFTSCDIITTLYYILSKTGKQKALDAIEKINKLCSVIEFGNAEIEESCKLMKTNKDFKDLEDTIQYVMAKKVGCDLILSNDMGFASDAIELMSSSEFVASMEG
jgi:predicted nucleic acid-binding protein